MMANIHMGSAMVDARPLQNSMMTHTNGMPPRTQSNDDLTSMEGIEEDSDHDMMPDQTLEGDGSGGKGQKRRRSRKGLDKRYNCDHEGCGKFYSRAEHLYRHQLNHQPKQIFNCDFPDCDRSFVRHDLCVRHRERHTNKGSQLQRKDAAMNQTRKEERKSSIVKPASPDAMSSVPSSANQTPISGASHQVVLFPPQTTSSNITTSQNGMDIRTKLSRNTGSEAETTVRIKTEYTPSMVPNVAKRRKSSFDIGEGSSPVGVKHQRPTFTSPHGSHSVSPFTKPTLETSLSTPSMIGLSIASPFPTQSPVTTMSYNHMQLPTSRHVQEANPNQPTQYSMPMNTNTPTIQSNHYPTSQTYPSFTIPSPAYTNIPISTQGPAMYGITSPPTSSGSNDPRHRPGIAAGFVDQSAMPGVQNSIPVFGSDSLKRAPVAYMEDFNAWLFNENLLGGGAATSFFDNHNALANGGIVYDMDPNHPFFPNGIYHPMAVTSLIAPPSPPQESLLSEHKRHELIDLMETYPKPRNFHYHLHPSGDVEGPFSLQNMQNYIALFWQHFHPQLPILHKPTFVADKTPNLLLIAMMIIGSSLLDRKEDEALARAGTEISSWLALNIRWQIFNNPDFRPPAKLWIFQALLILETFEKMYTTRELHERAHIHHGTTLTLMRRGSSLQGRCALDSPPSVHSDKPGSESSHGATNTHDDWWNRWIVSEATKRCAFASFIIDSIHATMFGHSAVMVAHEMRLALPCDESLWAATTAAEVARVEHSLSSAGIKPVSFLEGLKKTLNKQPVHTNAFGRTIIMAGLLNYSWHMNQRDLNVTTIGISQAMGGKDKWRSMVTYAIDFWRNDFDQSLKSSMAAASSSVYEGIEYLIPTTEDIDHENNFGNRTVLHHLAHMALHVDIVDLQIYAGASRLLGRSIPAPDILSTQKRMKDWANTVKARDATYYALLFLRNTFVPAKNTQPPQYATGPNGIQVLMSKQPPYDETAPPAYSARDDFLLNRPWVLYFAMLIVWSYGFALDSVLEPAKQPPIGTAAEKNRDMRQYLIRMSSVKGPDDLVNVRDRNQNLGLLYIMCEQFEEMRWELLKEGSKRLRQCIEISTGKIQLVKT